MRCLVCRSVMKREKGKTDFWIKEKLAIVDDVPFYKCQTCGEKLFDPSTSQLLISRLTSQKTKDFIKVPVYHL